MKYSIVEKYSNAYIASGKGGLDFDLHKMRGDFDFVLFSSNDPASANAIYHKNFSDWANILGDSQPIARSQVVSFTGKDEPIVPRLGLTKSGERKVSITWTSGRKDKNAKVRWRYVGDASWQPTEFTKHDTGDKRPILWRTGEWVRIQAQRVSTLRGD